MQTLIINGKEIAKKNKEEIIFNLKKVNTNKKPQLVIFYIGYNVASELYIKYKVKFANECNVLTKVIHLKEEDITQNEIIELIKEYNKNDEVDGIMVQLPINMKHLDANKIINTIHPDKDVDGLTSHNLGLTWFNNSSYLNSSTALACMEILDSIHYDFKAKNVVIIGNTIVLGKPLAGIIDNKNATISILNSHTPNLKYYTTNADLIITATGKKNLLTKDMIKENAVLIDVGTNKDENHKTHGDFEVNEMLNKASVISPSPGGVGPITISILIKNTVKAFLKKIKENIVWKELTIKN